MWLQLQYTEELKSMSKIQEAFKNKKDMENRANKKRIHNVHKQVNITKFN